jgi:hypothetical protein
MCFCGSPHQALCCSYLEVHTKPFAVIVTLSPAWLLHLFLTHLQWQLPLCIVLNVMLPSLQHVHVLDVLLLVQLQ